MIGILWLFLQSAASHLLYLALRLETGSFPKPLSAKEEQAAFAAMRAGDFSQRHAEKVASFRQRAAIPPLLELLRALRPK